MKSQHAGGQKLGKSRIGRGNDRGRKHGEHLAGLTGQEEFPDIGDPLLHARNKFHRTQLPRRHFEPDMRRSPAARHFDRLGVPKPQSRPIHIEVKSHGPRHFADHGSLEIGVLRRFPEGIPAKKHGAADRQREAGQQMQE